MTPVMLLESFKTFAEDALKDLRLQTKGGARRPPGVHLMDLPPRDDDRELAPYLLIQFLTGVDEGHEGGFASECRVRAVAAAYSDDGGVGGMDVLNVLSRLRTELQKAGVLANQFLLKPPLEYIVYPDDTYPYYLGEMMSVWEIPSVEREISSCLHPRQDV